MYKSILLKSLFFNYIDSFLINMCKKSTMTSPYGFSSQVDFSIHCQINSIKMGLSIIHLFYELTQVTNSKSKIIFVLANSEDPVVFLLRTASYGNESNIFTSGNHP